MRPARRHLQAVAHVEGQGGSCLKKIGHALANQPMAAKHMSITEFLLDNPKHWYLEGSMLSDIHRLGFP